MAVSLCESVRIRVPLAGDVLEAQVWRADVGRTPLYLLDAPGVTDRPNARIRDRERCSQAPSG